MSLLVSTYYVIYEILQLELDPMKLRPPQRTTRLSPATLYFLKVLPSHVCIINIIIIIIIIISAGGLFQIQHEMLL